MGRFAFTTSATPAWDVLAGDTYVVGTVGGKRETREVLEVLRLTPMQGAILLVQDPRGDVFRAHVGGRLDVVHE